MKLFVMSLMMLALGTSLAAQGAPTSWTLKTYQGATVVGPTLGLPASAVSCDKAPEPGVDNVVNPKRIGFNDYARAGRQCQADVSAYVTALPDGTGYTFELTAENADGAAVGVTRSNPFVRRRSNPPSAPSGVVALP